MNNNDDIKWRLWDVKPEVFARELTARTFDHLGALESALGLKQTPPNTSERTKLYTAAVKLARYALLGADIESRRQLEQVLEVVRLGFASPLDDGKAAMAAREVTDFFGVVLAAAEARMQIAERKEPLTLTQLSVLSGITTQGIAQKIRDEEIAAKLGQAPEPGQVRRGHKVAAKEATRWLRTRGVPGF